MKLWNISLFSFLTILFGSSNAAGVAEETCSSWTQTCQAANGENDANVSCTSVPDDLKNGSDSSAYVTGPDNRKIYDDLVDWIRSSGGTVHPGQAVKETLPGGDDSSSGN